MSSMFEQAIVDAAALKEAAIKNAENIILEKYAIELKEAVSSILEQDEEDPLAALSGGDMGGSGLPPTEDPLAQKVPMAATDGETACACPEADEEIEIDFAQLTQQSSPEASTGTNQDLPGQMGELAPEDEMMMELAGDETEEGSIKLPSELGPELHMWHMSMDDPVYELGSSIIAGKSVSKQLVQGALDSLEKVKQMAVGGDPEDVQQLEQLISQLSSASSQGQSVDAGEPEGAQPTMESIEEEVEVSENEINEEALAELLESLEVDMQVVPHGHAGHATTGEREEATEIHLARAQDDRVAEENKNLTKALEKLKESLTNLKEANKNLILENEKVKNIALQASEKLGDINLENAKLIYENRALRSDSLNERQKVIIVEAISKVGSIGEAKVVFETLSKSSNGGGSKLPQTLNEAISAGKGGLLSFSNKTNKESISSEENSTKERMRKLAGIKKDS